LPNQLCTKTIAAHACELSHIKKHILAKIFDLKITGSAKTKYKTKVGLGFCVHLRLSQLDTKANT